MNLRPDRQYKCRIQLALSWLTLLMINTPFCRGFAADATPEALQSYSVGRQIGAAMLAGCDVALVKVSAVGEFKRDPAVSRDMAPPAARLELKVAEWLNNAKGTTNATLSVSCVRRPELTKQSGGPWTVWEGIEPRHGQSLLIGLWTPDAPRPTWEGRPLEIAFAFAEADRIASARSVLRVHSDFLRQPAGLLNRVADPNQKLENTELGYLDGYVFDQESRRDVDAAARLGAKLIRHRGILPAARTDMIGKLEIEFYRLAEGVRAEVGGDLSEIATNREDAANSVALQVLARLVESQQFQLKLDQNRRRSLQESYRAWLAKGGSAYPRFASELGSVSQ